MALTTRRDDAALAGGIQKWLSCHEGLDDPVVTEVDRPSAGYSSETVVVGVSWRIEGVPFRKSLVVRMAPPEIGTFRDYDVRSQWQAQMAAAAAGVPVADPVVETDPVWLGAPFIVMPRVDGHIIGAVAHLDRWLSGQSRFDQARVYRSFVTTLSHIHGADLATVNQVPRRDNRAELDFWDEYLHWSSGGSPVPVLVEALDWCRRHRPDAEPAPALLWGDARFENMVFSEDLRPVAVLDWDMTTVGAPEHDLAWFTSLDLTMHKLFGARTDGFPSRADTIALFEEGEGRPVQDLEWYETLAMVRSTAVMTRIGYLQRNAGEPLMLPIEDNPLLDLLRSRVA
ncbi:MAG TPA: phosphotransferase family protein [Acidimicrobiales bacterium]|nr:phosphotransferase family protein [Acidimicrobiales bacterium]